MKSIQFFICLAFLSFGSFSAMAEDAAPCRTLNLIMSDMAAQMRAISRNYEDPKNRDAVLGFVDQLKKLVTEAQACPVTEFMNVPEPEHSARVEAFRVKLTILLAAIDTFRGYVAASDPVSAKNAFAGINVIRHEGHDTFNPAPPVPPVVPVPAL